MQAPCGQIVEGAPVGAPGTPFRVLQEPPEGVSGEPRVTLPGAPRAPGGELPGPPSGCGGSPRKVSSASPRVALSGAPCVSEWGEPAAEPFRRAQLSNLLPLCGATFPVFSL